MAELVKRGQGAPPRPLRVLGRDAAARARGAPDRRGAVANTRCGAAIPSARAASSRRAASSASASCAYSPLGRGFLTGKVKRLEDLGADDFRHTTPRFAARELRAQPATRRGGARRSPPTSAARRASSRALAWLLEQGDFIAPIPGTKRRKYLEDNAGAVGVRLDAADLARGSTGVLPPGAAAGERYSAIGMRLTNA